MQKYSSFLEENSTSFAIFEIGRHFTLLKQLLQRSLGGHTSLLHLLHSPHTKLPFLNSCSNLFMILILKLWTMLQLQTYYESSQFLHHQFVSFLLYPESVDISQLSELYQYHLMDDQSRLIHLADLSFCL